MDARFNSASKVAILKALLVAQLTSNHANYVVEGAMCSTQSLQ